MLLMSNSDRYGGRKDLNLSPIFFDSPVDQYLVAEYNFSTGCNTTNKGGCHAESSGDPCGWF
jgi:hypothetical protein